MDCNGAGGGSHFPSFRSFKFNSRDILTKSEIVANINRRGSGNRLPINGGDDKMPVNEVIAVRSPEATLISGRPFRPKITVFHCVNSVSNLLGLDSSESEVQAIKMPCSSMTREVFLLRAFEAGADAVIVMVCPEGSCRHLQGNIRAAKRVARVKKLLDEIGLDGGRLNIFNVSQKDSLAAERIIKQTELELDTLGANPAA